MPVHRVPLSDVETYIEAIEQTERIIAVESSGDGAVLVFTEARDQRRIPGKPETR